MRIIVNTSTMIPIYEQIMVQIKDMINSGILKAGTPLPSVRGLSKELKISALTVKKAYDLLEEEHYVSTIHGKGTYVLEMNVHVLKEERLQLMEKELEVVIDKAKLYQLNKKEIIDLISLIWGDEDVRG